MPYEILRVILKIYILTVFLPACRVAYLKEILTYHIVLVRERERHIVKVTLEMSKNNQMSQVSCKVRLVHDIADVLFVNGARSKR